MKLKPLEEQTFVITGGSSGIGLATARMAAERGATVVIVSRDEEGMRRICDELREHGGRCDYVAADVGERDQVRRVVASVIERHGGFDTWVNNAGVGAYAKLEELSDEDHERIFKTNYWGVVYGSTEALKHLKERGGALINTGSISSEMPAPLLSAYTASKFAVKGFTDSLRLELMHDEAPVSVTLIQPSGIHTPFGYHAKNYMDAASKVPPPVYAPELVAEAICSAAEHPARDVIIGGAGRIMTTASRLFPRLTDKLYSNLFFVTAKDKSRPPREHHGGFAEAGSSGELYGDQQDSMRKTSFYTAFQNKPARTLATVAAVGVAGAAVTGFLLRPRAVGEQQPTVSKREPA
ncbi:SDR family oxidoreductase [Sphingosinicella sp. CPCC 101087]|uniref:SDR family oxidoreductase n=1 Tax=Sphingosinicella sp. CPCC 101087 TaxID=2497754 RepID=UPI00101D9927|nr:SDR family oxidoreductase [Sphingosinicella sp. CPCC 101087]